MNKYVIYTILTGGYEDVVQPLVIDDRFDYVLFSNDFDKEKVGIWKVRPIPAVVDLSDNKRLSRYPKSHPETMLREYEASLYMDANIQIADKWVYERFFELREKNIELAGIKLVVTGRDDIYRHAYDICMMKAEHDMPAIRQMHELHKRGFPEHYGLNENNIIFRAHTENMQKADEEWWWWITNYSFRDQFSYMYCLWKYDIKREYFLPEGEDSHNSSHFNFIPHNDGDGVVKKKWLTPGFFEKKRNKCRNINKYQYDKYCEHWVRLCKMPCPRICLFLWGLIVYCMNIPRFYFPSLFNLVKNVYKKE